MTRSPDPDGASMRWAPYYLPRADREAEQHLTGFPQASTMSSSPFESSEGYAIGIDLGTANIRTSVYRNGEVELIPDADGRRCMESYVAFTKRARLFGNAAKAQAGSNIKNTVHGSKLMIGSSLNDSYFKGSSQDMLASVQDCGGGVPAVQVKYRQQDHQFTAKELCATILGRVKLNAEAYLSKKVIGSVITVPSLFTTDQRDDIRDAAALAGLKVLHIGNGIDMAALWYAVRTRSRDVGRRLVTIIDIGAGYCSFGLVELEMGVVQIISSTSHRYCAGDDILRRLMSMIARRLKHACKLDMLRSATCSTRRRLRFACEAAMRSLSSMKSTKINVETAPTGEDNEITITRARFELDCHDLLRCVLANLDLFLTKLRTRYDESMTQEVVMVGGPEAALESRSFRNLYRDIFMG